MEKGRGDGKYCKERKKEYTRVCEENKKKEGDRWEKEVEGIRTEGPVWKVVNRERKRRRG